MRVAFEPRLVEGEGIGNVNLWKNISVGLHISQGSFQGRTILAQYIQGCICGWDRESKRRPLGSEIGKTLRTWPLSIVILVSE